MPKVRAKRSAIWLHFSEYSEHDRSTMVKCNACNVALPYCRNTTNLWSHIRIHHKSILNSSLGSPNAERQKSLSHCTSTSTNVVATDPSGDDAQAPSSASDTVQQYPANSKRAQEITNSLLLMIAADVYPFSIVNGKEFIGFVRALDERYALPDRAALTSKYLPSLYLSRCKEIADKLSTVDSVHLAIDSWTNVNRKMSFLSITAYYCARETVQDYTLQVSYVPAWHGTESLWEIVGRTADAWKIASKVRTVVYDCASNPGANARPPWRQIFCFASMLNMVVCNAIGNAESILNVFSKCRDIVELSKSSRAVAETFKSEKIRQNYPKAVTLRRDIPGQWKSTYLMLRNLLDLRSIFTAAHADLSQKGVPRIAQHEWEIVAGVIRVLNPIYEAAEEVSAGDNNVAVSKIIPIVHLIQAALENHGDVAADVKLLRANLLNELAACFENIEAHPVYSFATFLDPRYRDIAFHSYECVALVQNQLMSRCGLGETADNDTDARVATQQTNHEITDTDDTLWAEFDKKVQEAAAETECTSNSVKDQLEGYLRLKLINRKSNPISWWNTEGKTLFPKLARVALEYLSIPATCVSKEPLFSKVVQILAHRRTRIQPKYVNMLSVLNLNQNK